MADGHEEQTAVPGLPGRRTGRSGRAPDHREQRVLGSLPPGRRGHAVSAVGHANGASA